METGQGVGANYLRFDFPFPASDRDVVLRARTQVETENEVIFDVENVDGLVPETSGVVRIPLLVARWEFRSHGDGATEVVYRQRMEAGGRLPAFIVNRSSVDSPYGTLVGLWPPSCRAPGSPGWPPSSGCSSARWPGSGW